MRLGSNVSRFSATGFVVCSSFFLLIFLRSDDSTANCQSGLADARPPVSMCVEHCGDLMEQGNENQKKKSSSCDFEKSLSLFKQELSEVDSAALFLLCCVQAKICVC